MPTPPSINYNLIEGNENKMDLQEQKLKEIFDYYREQDRGNETLREMLREIQEDCGGLSPEILETAAKELDVKVSVLSCLVKFSSDLKMADYKHTITVCTGERCGNKDSGRMLKLIKEQLEIGKDGISRDGKILLKTRCCLKHCKTAPNLLIDGELIPQVTKEQLMDKIAKILD